MFNLRAFH